MKKPKITKQEIIDDLNLSPQEKYYKYIKTEEWNHIRSLVLDRDNYTCRCCGRTGEEAVLSVHHSTYNHLFDEENNLSDLITLCKFCHSGIHRVPSNRLRFRFNKE